MQQMVVKLGNRTEYPAKEIYNLLFIAHSGGRQHSPFMLIRLFHGNIHSSQTNSQSIVTFILSSLPHNTGQGISLSVSCTQKHTFIATIIAMVNCQHLSVNLCSVTVNSHCPSPKCYPLPFTLNSSWLHFYSPSLLVLQIYQVEPRKRAEIEHA